jgi:hypothetical protein
MRYIVFYTIGTPSTTPPVSALVDAAGDPAWS